MYKVKQVKNDKTDTQMTRFWFFKSMKQESIFLPILFQIGNTLSPYLFIYLFMCDTYQLGIICEAFNYQPLLC